MKGGRPRRVMRSEREKEMENRNRLKKENSTMWHAAMEQMKRRGRGNRGNREDERDSTVEAR